MQARFLCGPAGSGKTFRCLAEVRDTLQPGAEGPPLVFISPKQATFQLERQLLTDQLLSGFARLQILSFDRLARFVFDKLQAALPEFLSDEGRVMVLRALLLRHVDELKLFRGSARRPGFAQEISKLLNEFQQNQLSPARLRALAGNDSLRPELRQKLADLALLHGHYRAWLTDNWLQDANNLLAAATEMLRANAGHAALQISALWLDGFAEMTPQELDFLAAILPFCQRATLAFCLDESVVAQPPNSQLSLWNAVGKTFQQCRQRIEGLSGCKIEIEILRRDSRKGRFQNSTLRHLEAHWEGTRNIATNGDDEITPLQMVACQNPETEATFAAREILKFVRRGNRFRDCAVLVRSLDPYHKALARTFRRYEIPFFLDRRESVAHHPLAELTRNALRTIAFDWRHEDWFAALKTGFYPGEETEIDGLENAALEHGWRGKKWREPIQIPDHTELEKRLERLRKKVMPPFEALYGNVAAAKFQPTGKQLAECLRTFWQDMRVEETLERWNAGEASSTASRQPAVHATVWEGMNLWLENVALAFAKEAMSLRDWLPVLDAGLANLTVGVIPPALDEILIGAVDRARNPELKLCLVLGANETIFPAAPTPPVILTGADRDELNQVVSLGANVRERLARERYYGYIAFTRASERLAISFSRSDTEGRLLNPSSFITHLQTIFPKISISDYSGHIEPGEIVGANELVPRLVEMQKAGEAHNAKWEEQILAVSPSLADWVHSLNGLHEPDPAENLSPALAEKLYGPVLKTSVSRLEEFAQCPFRFFVRSGLRAGERKVFEMDARERGTFQHDVLKIFHEQLVKENKRWRDLTPQEARERIGQIATLLAADFRGGLLRDTPQTRFAARAMAESLQNFVEVAISWMQAQYQFDPTVVEWEFGGEDPRMPAWEVALDGGRKLALRGRIDRIDLCRREDDALAVVLDYKSGGKKLDALLVENGIQLQLAAYLNALLQLKNPRELFSVEKLIPTGVFYINLRGQFENGKTRAEILSSADKARRAAYRHTGRFDASALGKLDSTGAADQFNYRRTQDGSLHKGSTEAMTREEFIAWLDGVEAQLRRIGNAIFSGAAQVDPYRKGKETPCEYCDYSAACRIDPWTHHYRSLSSKAASTE